MLFITARTTVPWLPGFPGTYEDPVQDVTVEAAQASLGHRTPPSPHITPQLGLPLSLGASFHALPPSTRGGKTDSYPNQWIGEHWHWLYESHLRATMQLQLISFALIILHCMDYTGCQQHSSSRHWQHKREYHQCRTKQPEFSCTRGIFTFKFTNLDPNTATERLNNQLAGCGPAITRAHKTKRGLWGFFFKVCYYLLQFFWNFLKVEIFWELLRTPCLLYSVIYYVFSTCNLMYREVCSTMNSRLFEVPFGNCWSTLSMQPLTLIARINYRPGPGTRAPPLRLSPVAL